MQNLYPLFERNRILKKELLWSLRDYSFAHIQLEYQEYSQGILRGCDLSVQDNELAVGPGILKYGRFICLLMEEERISYSPANQIQYLKLKAEIDGSSPDYIAYRTELLLDSEGEQGENEFELCRFNLRNGAKLRAHYTNFFDLETEYDTMNLIHAAWGGLGGRTLAPAVTRYFFRELLRCEGSQPEDRALAYLCLSQPGTLPASVLSDYVNRRLGEDITQIQGNEDLYKKLCVLLKEISLGSNKRIKKERERHRIIVD